MQALSEPGPKGVFTLECQQNLEGKKSLLYYSIFFPQVPRKMVRKWEERFSMSQCLSCWCGFYKSCFSHFWKTNKTLKTVLYLSAALQWICEQHGKVSVFCIGEWILHSQNPTNMLIFSTGGTQIDSAWWCLIYCPSRCCSEIYNKCAPLEIINNNECCLWIRSQYTNSFCMSLVFSIAIVYIQKSSLKVKCLENGGHVMSSGIFIYIG